MRRRFRNDRMAAPRALAAHGVDSSTFSAPGRVYQMGVPPSRIDILTSIDGVDFDLAWRRHVRAPFGNIEAPVIDLPTLRQNKQASGRAKDLADLALLDELSIVRGSDDRD